MLKRITFTLSMLSLFILFGCNLPQSSTPTPDEGFLAFTQSAQTVEARLTEMAVTSTPTPPGAIIPVTTNTPLPTATPAPAQPTVALCDMGTFVDDVTVPDGTAFDPGTLFTKTWRLKNTGTCPWTTGYSVVFDKGNAMGASWPVPMPKNVNPGETVDISINMVSPSAEGAYSGYWKLRNASGVVFGLGSEAKPFYVAIKVGTSDKATVYNFTSNYCAAQWSSGAGVLPCPGVDGDASGFVLKQAEPYMENGSKDDEAALLTQPQKVDNGYIAGRFPSFKVQNGDRFRAVLACENGSNACNVQYLLNYSVGGGAEQTYASWNKVYNGELLKVNADLSPLAGKDVVFILRVNANGSSDQDRALWLQPRIVR